MTRLCLLYWLHTHISMCVICCVYISHLYQSNMKKNAIIWFFVCARKQEKEREIQPDKPFVSAKRNDHNMINCYHADCTTLYSCVHAQHPHLENMFIHKHAKHTPHLCTSHTHLNKAAYRYVNSKHFRTSTAQKNLLLSWHIDSK